MLGLCWPMLSGQQGWAVLRLFWAHLEELGPSWAQVGPMLAYVGSMLALCWPMLALSWPMLALSWPYVGPMLALRWPMLAPCWPILGPMLRLCWRYVRPSLLKDFQDANCSSFFLPGPLRRRTKNHVKTTVFYFRQKKIGSAEATKHSEKQCFCDPTHTHTKHRKLH